MKFGVLGAKMKTIKIKFVGFWEDFKNYSLLNIYRILEKYYKVEISDNPDYIICTCFSEPYEFLKYPQVRIMITEENFIPDFNQVDYAICPYPIKFLDRSFYYPTFVKPLCASDYTNAEELEHKQRKYDLSFVKNKQFFANFIYSHESENNIRGDFFKKLCEYKRVESPGKYLNNLDSSNFVEFRNESKTDFQRKCKFSICFESTKSEGFITEKIVDAFYADTIPIYYGSNTVSDIFNPKAFINCNDFDSFDDAIEYVKRIDQDDGLYLEMLNQDIFINPNYVSDVLNNYENYIRYIFDQPKEQAFRRSRVFSAKKYEDYIINIKQQSEMLSKIVYNTFLGRVSNSVYHKKDHIISKFNKAKTD